MNDLEMVTKVLERVAEMAHAAPRGILGVDPFAQIGFAMVGPNCVMMSVLLPIEGLPVYDSVMN